MQSSVLTKCYICFQNMLIFTGIHTSIYCTSTMFSDTMTSTKWIQFQDKQLQRCSFQQMHHMLLHYFFKHAFGYYGQMFVFTSLVHSTCFHVSSLSRYWYHVCAILQDRMVHCHSCVS